MGKQELGPLQTKWVEDLESGNFKQGNEVLYDPRTDTYCCLGVCEKGLGNLNNNGHTISDRRYAELSKATKEKMFFRGTIGLLGEGIKLNTCNDLAAANDTGTSFAEIAAFIRANPEAVFTEPA